MKSRIKNYFQSKAAFWKAKLFFNEKIAFNYFRKIYAFKHSYRDKNISARLLISTLGAVLRSAVYAAFFIFIFEFLNNILGHYIPLQISDEELGLLISTVVTVTGVFLALYFTAISAVAGNLFMRATENLQNLFIRGKKGKQYIETLVFTTVIGIFYLLLRSFGFPISPFGPIIITVLATYSIIRFMTLGSQTFYFIHPIEASVTTTDDAAYAIDNVTLKGFGWKKPYLQDHYRKQADYALDTLNSLINFGINVIKLSEEQLVSIARYTGALMDYYLDRKKQIPTDSYWFETKYQFQSWVLADSVEITTALSTGKTLRPRTVKDRIWFEERCVNIFLTIFNYLISKKQWGSANQCLEVLVTTAEKRLGADLYDYVGNMIIDKVQNTVHNIVITSENPTDDETRKGHLAIIDNLGRLGVCIQVSLLQYLDQRTCEDLAYETKLVKWTNAFSIYNTKLPGKILSTLESTANRLKTELLIEGRQISPEWYLITITTSQYLFELQKYYEFLKSLHIDLFKKNIEELIKRKKYLHAAHLVERWIEFTNKLLICGWRVQKLVEECGTLRKVRDLPWVSIDFEKEKTILQKYDREAVDKLVYLLPFLSSLSEPDLHDLPDYFGQAYTFGVEAAYETCYDNDTERFKRIFSNVFFGALAAHDTTRKQVQGWSQESQIVFSTEPLEDLLNVSGFAKLYAELYQNPCLWNACKTLWDNYLNKGNARDIIMFLNTISQYRDSIFLLMPKATLRTNWDIKFRQKLEEMGLTVDQYEFRYNRKRRVNHASPLIRVISCYPDILPVDARTVFFVTYLSKHVAAQGMNIPDRRGLEQQIERETNPQENDEQ